MRIEEIRAKRIKERGRRARKYAREYGIKASGSMFLKLSDAAYFEAKTAAFWARIAMEAKEQLG